MSKSKAVVSIVLGRSPYQETFNNVEELEKWLANERRQFDWIENAISAEVTHDRDYLEKLRGIINGWHKAVSKLISDWKSHAHDEKELKKTIDDHRIALLGGYKAEEIFLSSSRDMAFIFGLRDDRSMLVAAYALCFLMNLDMPSTKDATEGLFWALRYREGSLEAIKAQASVLEILATKWSGNFQEQCKKNQESADNQHSRSATLISELESLKHEARTQLEQEKADHAELQEMLKADLENIKNAFSMGLAMKEPVTYWMTKRNHHQKVMWYMAGGTFLVALISVSVFICVAYQFSQANVGQNPYPLYGILFAILTGGIWLTRICSKIFISNLHLRTDADERVTMCQTYLAMLALGAGLTETDRRLMLQTLFRPSSTGFIKEDGPSGFFELMKILDRKGG